MTTEFHQKNVLITGAGRGIGKRLAIGFAKAGARIALLARSKAEIDLAQIEIEHAGGNALRIRADVTDPEQLTAAVERVRIAFGGPVDVLVCAAATPGPIQPFLNTPRPGLERHNQYQFTGRCLLMPRRTATHVRAPCR